MPSRKGSPDKRKQALIALLRVKYGEGWHPVEKMAAIAEDTSNSIELRAKMYSDVAQYVEPKLRAMDVTFAQDGHLDVTVRLVPHDED